MAVTAGSGSSWRKSVEQRKPFHRLVRRDLSEKGVSEAKAAGKLLKEERLQL